MNFCIISEISLKDVTDNDVTVFGFREILRTARGKETCRPHLHQIPDYGNLKAQDRPFYWNTFLKTFFTEQAKLRIHLVGLQCPSMLATQIGGHEGTEYRHTNTEKLGSGGLCSLKEKLLHPESLLHFFFNSENKEAGLLCRDKQGNRASIYSQTKRQI